MHGEHETPKKAPEQDEQETPSPSDEKKPEIKGKRLRTGTKGGWSIGWDSIPQ